MGDAEKGEVSLFWRVFATNALVFAVAAAALAVSPATVSSPVLVSELLILVAGLAVILVGNALLLRVSFSPLEHLTRLMQRVDLLRPGQRLSLEGYGEVAAVIEAFNDMLDRLEAERRTSSARAMRAQEAERRRIARELHDEIGQSLTAILLQLNRIASGTRGETHDQIREVQEAARETLDEVRGIARQIRPDVLEELGLVSALTALGTSFFETTGIPVERRFDSGLPPFHEDVELALYRIAQESLTNVARHADASRVVLSLQRSAHGVTLRIADDGRGLDGAADGAGLRGMRERAVLVGADLRIASRRPRGVEVSVHVDGADHQPIGPVAERNGK